MQTLLQLVVVACALSLASCAHDFSNYPFKTTLNTEEDGGLYELYWNFDNDAERIDFAVRVQTTGWVGFGLSPNGQMPNSDVVIGWVTDDGDTVFHDRFAAARAPPAIDEEQNWFLKSGEEEEGFTILEFSRDYVTCDDRDLPINAGTARVIWSFLTGDDPASEELSFDDFHSREGSMSLNLLGGLPSKAPEPEDLQYYDITVDNITIPKADTTYWCAAFRLPEDIRTQTRYVTGFGPIVTVGNDAHVHHLLIYLCEGLNDTHVGNGGDCEVDVANEVAECRGGTVIAAWAVGGENFYYPNNVAATLGGVGSHEYLVMELHYDNPTMIEGTLDSSGIRVWYTSTPREHVAGTIALGHFVTPRMIIPPNVDNFTITAILPPQCTSLLPEGGIHAFANILHTHVVGHGLALQHFRYNSDCDVYEELEPIDRNLQYDFNFQQINHLRREVTILPGDILQLKCFYRTNGVDTVTLGGLSTRDEMCVSFLYYYPKIDAAAISGSQISEQNFTTYLESLPSGEQILADQVNYKDGLNAVNWDETAAERLQDTYDESIQEYFCSGADFNNALVGYTTFPENICPYIAPDQCTDSTPPTCCERINNEVEDGGMILRASLALLLVLSLLATVMG